MGLSFKTIHAIKDSNPEDSWNEALMKWILQDYNTEKHDLPSWKSLLKAVSRVDPRLFEKLAKEHQLQVKGTSITMNFISCYHNTIYYREGIAIIRCLISNLILTISIIIIPLIEFLITACIRSGTL